MMITVVFYFSPQVLEAQRLRSIGDAYYCVAYPHSTKLRQCLKITEKVVFNNPSEASYVYILIGQKSIKNAQKWSIWRGFENLKLVVKQCYQMVENPKKEMRHFWWFSNTLQSCTLSFTTIKSLFFLNCTRSFESKKKVGEGDLLFFWGKSAFDWSTGHLLLQHSPFFPGNEFGPFQYWFAMSWIHPFCKCSRKTWALLSSHQTIQRHILKAKSWAKIRLLE